MANSWTSTQFTDALRHIQSNPGYNADLRQLLHVGFKIAAQMGDTYIQALKDHSEVVAKNVTANLLDRHMKPLFYDVIKHFAHGTMQQFKILGSDPGLPCENRLGVKYRGSKTVYSSTP